MPLERCWARPPRGNRELLLVDHLEQVATMAAAGASGDEAKELFSAGLLHDVGKARASWQAYIRNQSQRSVNHAFLGAALFFWGWSRPKVAVVEQYPRILELTRDIANHHGPLNDLEDDPPWTEGWQRSALAEVDWRGISDLVRRRCPYLPEIPTDPAQLEREFKQLPYLWQRWLEECTDYDIDVTEAAARSIRIRTACLIQADRFDAAALSLDPGIGAPEAAGVQGNIQAFIDNGLPAKRDHPMLAYRQRVAREVLDRLEHLSEFPSRLFTLELPTGAGKTLLALQVAMSLIRQQGGGRLIYVAPYLSILNQSVNVLSRATGLEVLEHHHMATLGPAGDEILREEDILIQESWQAPVVATTFNQFFRALFPVRAHESMRLAALARAVVIVDEPQVINPEAWAVFLKGLEQAVEVYRGYAILSTATLPPLQTGRLEHHPISLVANPPPLPAPRYRLQTESRPWNASEVVSRALEEVASGKTCAVILNTIRDAAEVYQLVKTHSSPDIETFMVTGAMSALHKQHRVQKIFRAVNGSGSVKVLVVSTQVLEAGVDLSFGTVLRARPLVPSIVQSAGRVNRHGEQLEPGRICVFDYLRDDGSDSRRFVYRDRIGREETDRLLSDYTEVHETEVGALVDAYYRAVFQRHSYDGTLQKFVQAANGRWSALGGLEPFEADVPTVPVFIALTGGPADGSWADGNTQGGLARFGCQNPEHLFERYVERGYLGSLSFPERKYFLTLLLRFCVNMPIKRVLDRVEHFENRVVVRWIDLQEYNEESGLANILLEDGGALFL